MNRKKLLSAIVALAIYCGIIFLVLFYYNIHKIEAKKFVDRDDKRVTVTLVNSNKTVLNKKSEKSNKVKPHIVTPPIPLKRDTPKKVIPKKHVVKKHTPKKVVPKKVTPKKVVPKKHVVTKHTPKKVVPKKVIPKKVVPKKHVVKKHTPKKVIPKKVIPKKVVPKKHVVKKHTPKKVIPKKVTPKKVVPKKHVVKKYRPKKVVPEEIVPYETVTQEYRPKKVVPKENPHDLFSRVKTHRVKKAPVIKRPAPPPRIRTVQKRPKPVFSEPYKEPQRQSRVKHSSSVTDRIKNSHLSGRVSNTNRNSGVKNAYIARVRRHMNNWTASSAYQGQRVTIILTIYQNGTFNYTVSGGGANMQNSLRTYLDRLNRIGLGRHNKSSPYHIKVPFTVR